jgi:hypothetical protein
MAGIKRMMSLSINNRARTFLPCPVVFITYLLTSLANSHGYERLGKDVNQEVKGGHHYCCGNVDGGILLISYNANGAYRRSFRVARRITRDSSYRVSANRSARGIPSCCVRCHRVLCALIGTIYFKLDTYYTNVVRGGRGEVDDTRDTCICCRRRDRHLRSSRVIFWRINMRRSWQFSFFAERVNELASGSIRNTSDCKTIVCLQLFDRSFGCCSEEAGDRIPRQ